MTTPEYRGQQQAYTASSSQQAFRFKTQQLIRRIVTVDVVRVISVTSNGELAPAGRMSVQPLVNQLTGDGQSVPHGVISDILYGRLHGGRNAVILDPQPGDIGVCGFCRRDISAVKAARDIANPGSLREYDWADGIWLMSILDDDKPIEQYVRFASDMIEIVSPTKIRMQADTIELVGAVDQSGGTVSVATTLEAGTDVTGGGISLKTHTHSGVQTGGGTSGPPVP